MMRALANLIGKGSVTLVDDSGDVQVLQVTEGAQGQGAVDRIVDKVPRLTEFGFASVPPIGSLAMMLRRTADRARGFVMATSHPESRPTGLKPGDTVLYDVRGAKVQMTADGLVIDCAGLPAFIQNATHVTIKGSEKVTIDAPTLEVLQDMTVAGTIHATGRISTDTDVVVDGHLFTALRQAYGVHKHTGVQAGSGTSVGPDTAA